MEKSNIMQIIIPAANKKYHKHKKILEKNIDVFKIEFPCSSVKVITFSESEKFRNKVNLFINSDYTKTSCVKSIQMAIKDNSSCIIFHGNLKISKKIFKKINFKNSFVITLEEESKNSLGVNLSDNKVVNIEYGLPSKFSNLVFLKDKELSLFYKIVNQEEKSRHKLHEIINEVIRLGGSFQNFSINPNYIKELK